MIPYFILAFIILLSIWKKQKWLFSVLIGILSVFALLRDVSVGADNVVYSLNYNVISYNENTWSAFTEMENAYNWLMAFCKETLGFQYVSFMRLNAFVFLLGIFIFIKKCSVNYILSLFFFYFLTFYTSSFNIMRQYFGLALILIGYSCIFKDRMNEKKIIFLWLLFVIAVSIGFQKTLLIYLILPLFYINSLQSFFSNRKNSILILICSYALLYAPSIIISFIPVLSNYLQFAGDRYISYLYMKDFDTLSVYSALMDTAMIIVTIICIPKKNRNIIPLYLVIFSTVVANVLGGMSAIFLRVAMNLDIFKIILFPYAWFNCGSKKWFKIAIVLYSIIIFSKAIIKNFGKIVPYVVYGG